MIGYIRVGLDSSSQEMLVTEMRVCHLSRHMALQEIYEANRFLLFCEVKIHTVPEGHDVQAVGVRIVLEEQLL